VLHIRPLQASDVAHVVQLVQGALSELATNNEFINPWLDEEQFSNWLLSTSALVATNDGTIVGHIAGTTLDGEIWLNGDCVSFTSDDVLEALLAAAPFDGRAVNAWAGAPASEWLRCGFSPVSMRGTLALDRLRDVTSPPELVLRRATRDDLDALVHLDALLEVEQAGNDSTPLKFTSRDELADIVDDREVHCYLAERMGQPLGQVITFAMPDRRGSWPDTLHVTSVVTVPEARRTGVASSLIASAFNDAYSAGFAYCEVNWRTTNERAATFWEHYGFRATFMRLRREP